MSTPPYFLPVIYGTRRTPEKKNTTINELVKKGFIPSENFLNTENNSRAYTGKFEVLIVKEYNNGAAEIIQRQKRTYGIGVLSK